MSHIKSVFGYVVAFFSIVLAVATYGSNGVIGEEIVQRGNFVVSPNISGGEIIKTIHKIGYRVVIHEPVFLGLFEPKKNGFIQVDFFRENNAPILMREDIDFDEDNKIDFRILYNPGINNVIVKSYNPNVSTHFKEIERNSAYTVRINLTNPDYGSI